MLWCAKSLQLCLTLCPADCSTPGSSVDGILQARILEWVAISSSRGSSQPRDRTHVSCFSCTVRRFFTTEPPENLLGSGLAKINKTPFLSSRRLVRKSPQSENYNVMNLQAIQATEEHANRDGDTISKI